jgi:hypothetical protein
VVAKDVKKKEKRYRSYFLQQVSCDVFWE